MNASATVESPVDSAPEPRLGLLPRAIAVFARPTAAWTGLREQVQWWFPMLVVACVGALMAMAIHNRAIVPMMVEAWQQQVASGNMAAEQVDKMEAFFTSPAGLAITVVQQLIVLPIVTLLTALVAWFGVGFILGRPLRYRLALEVTAWAGLITIPTQLLTGVLAWTRETMKGVHVGFGILLPEPETPSRLGIWLGAVLDALGPLSLWYLAVLVIGAAAVSGAPRKTVAWVLGGLYLALVLLFSSLGALFAPVS